MSLHAEPAVSADALLDLALVMRERWWPEAALEAAAEESRVLISAAVARCFPAQVHTVERCPCEPDSPPEEGESKCDECPTDADYAASDARLTAFLAALPRPGVVLRVPPQVAPRTGDTADMVERVSACAGREFGQ